MGCCGFKCNELCSLELKKLLKKTKYNETKSGAQKFYLKKGNYILILDKILKTIKKEPI